VPAPWRCGGRHSARSSLDARGGGLGAQCLEQWFGIGIAVVAAARHGRDAVVGRGGSELRIAHRVAALAQLLQALHRIEIVQQVTIDMQQDEAVAEIGDHMLVPDFGEQRGGRPHA